MAATSSNYPQLGYDPNIRVDHRVCVGDRLRVWGAQIVDIYHSQLGLIEVAPPDTEVVVGILCDCKRYDVLYYNGWPLMIAEEVVDETNGRLHTNVAYNVAYGKSLSTKWRRKVPRGFNIETREKQAEKLALAKEREVIAAVHARLQKQSKRLKAGCKDPATLKRVIAFEKISQELLTLNSSDSNFIPLLRAKEKLFGP